MSNQSLNLDVIDDTKLYVVRETNSKIHKPTIASRVAAAINQFLLPDNNELGQAINMSQLTADILSLKGVKRIFTKNEKDGSIFNGLSFLSFNPLYPDSDIELVNQSVVLPYFKFPYSYNPLTLGNNIIVIDE